MPEEPVGAGQGELELRSHLVVPVAVELGESRVQCLHGLLEESGLEQDLRAVQPCRTLEDVGLELLGASHAGQRPRDVTEEVCRIPSL